MNVNIDIKDNKGKKGLNYLDKKLKKSIQKYIKKSDTKVKKNKSSWKFW